MGYIRGTTGPVHPLLSCWRLARTPLDHRARRRRPLGIELEAIIDRTEYGLTWNAPLPKGGFALANDVKLVVELEFAQA